MDIESSLPDNVTKALISVGIGAVTVVLVLVIKRARMSRKGNEEKKAVWERALKNRIKNKFIFIIPALIVVGIMLKPYLTKDETVLYYSAVCVVLMLYYTRSEKGGVIIARQKEELDKQNEIIKEKNREITDSIQYALRLQQAILPPLSQISTQFPEYFVLYRPKAIVAGDFYWMHSAGDTTLIAAADCTGHGVPGALVSIVCSNALNRTVNEFGLTETGKILDKVTELVLETFEKSGEEIKDGMDISLLSINKASGQGQWSGANNPLWIVKGGELTEIKADKQPRQE